MNTENKTEMSDEETRNMYMDIIYAYFNSKNVSGNSSDYQIPDIRSKNEVIKNAEKNIEEYKKLLKHQNTEGGNSSSDNNNFIDICEEIIKINKKNTDNNKDQ